MHTSPVILLIVDDDIDDRDLFFEAVAEVDPSCRCMSAQNGEEALEILKRDDIPLPAFIFLDLNMPRMNGMQFFTEMRKNKNFHHIQVIVYSTSRRLEDAMEMERLGAIAFITKPKTFSGICEAISSVIKGKPIATY